MATNDGYVSSAIDMIFQPQQFGANLVASDGLKGLKHAFGFFVATTALFAILVTAGNPRKGDIIFGEVGILVGFVPTILLLTLCTIRYVRFIDILSLVLIFIGSVWLGFLPIVFIAIFTSRGTRLGQSAFMMISPSPFIYAMVAVIFGYLMLIMMPKIISGMAKWSYLISAGVWIFCILLGSFIAAKLMEEGVS